jgi:hypothetical protein
VTDLRDDLAPLLQLAGTPIGELAERRHRRRSRRRLAGASTAAALVVLAGVAVVAGPDGDDPGQRVTADSDDGTPSTPVTASPDPTTTTGAPPEEPSHIVVRPATARPGEIVDLIFSEHADRGALFTLARWDGTAWEPASFGLTSDGHGAYDCADCPSWVAGPGPFDMVDIGISGPGPDRVEIPDVAPPGRYRVCFGYVEAPWCGQLDVAGDPVEAPPAPSDASATDEILPSRWLLRPGERFELRFPTELPRGVMSTLSPWDGTAWGAPVAQLHSSAAAYGEPRAELPGATFPSVQVNGPGPDPVVLPAELAPGWYRVCAGLTDLVTCTRIRVLDPLPDESGAPATTSSIEPSTADAPGSSSTVPSVGDEGAVVADPARVRPGEEVALRFPTGAERGLGWHMARWTGAGWTDPLYGLVSSGPDREWGTPSWSEGGSVAVRLILFSGPGPDHVVIPPVAESGIYAICTNVSMEVCATVEVAGE